MSELMKAEGLSFVYPDAEDEIPALHDVTFHVEKGHYMDVHC